MFEKHKKSDAHLLKLSFWCTAIVGGTHVRVRIRHIGRGKFQIIESDLDTGAKVIDASDILHCDV
jgi:hypothetical protein